MKFTIPILLMFASPLFADPIVQIQMGDDCESIANLLAKEDIKYTGEEEAFILDIGYFVRGTPVVIRCFEKTGVHSVQSISAFSSRKKAAEAYNNVHKRVTETLGEVDERLMYMTLNPRYGEGLEVGEKVACWDRKYGVTAIWVKPIDEKWYFSFETKPTISC